MVVAFRLRHLGLGAGPRGEPPGPGRTGGAEKEWRRQHGAATAPLSH